MRFINKPGDIFPLCHARADAKYKFQKQMSKNRFAAEKWKGIFENEFLSRIDIWLTDLKEGFDGCFAFSFLNVSFYF